MQTKTLGNYTLDILDITEFKKYYTENVNSFSTVAHNSFLKALDIPPKFFKEQPDSTQEILLDNRDIFIKEHKKYAGKVIIVLRIGSEILNACRLDKKQAETTFDKLKTIENISNKFEHRSFIKDGYITYIVSNDIKNKQENQVLAVDFPVLLNKKPVIHKAIYQLPDDTFATPVEHIHYLTSQEIDLDYDYIDIASAIKDNLHFLQDDLSNAAEQNILRENELVALALVETGTIPRSYQEKITNYITNNVKGELTTYKLESLVLDFDEELRSYKQVTSLREVSGYAVLKLLESDTFKSIVEAMEETLSEEPELIAI